MFVFGFKGLLPWWYSIKGHLFSFYVAILMSICAKICFFLFPKTSCHQGSTAHPCVAPQCIKSTCFRSTRTKASLTTRSAFRIGCLQLCRYPKVTFQLLGSKHRCSKQDFQGTIWKSCSTKHIADMQQESTLKGRCSAWFCKRFLPVKNGVFPSHRHQCLLFSMYYGGVFILQNKGFGVTVALIWRCINRTELN